MPLTPSLERVLLNTNPWLTGADLAAWLASKIPTACLARRAKPRVAPGRDGRALRTVREFVAS